MGANAEGKAHILLLCWTLIVRMHFVSLYYYSNFLVLPWVFCRLTTPPIFHRFQQFWYQNVQLLQEIIAMTFGVYNYSTF